MKSLTKSTPMGSQGARCLRRSLGSALCGALLLLLVAAAPAAATVCDILDAAGTPCVAAHSLTRALYNTYSGRLYQVKRASDAATMNVNTLPSGHADASAQDLFCAKTTCTVEIIYDQSPRENHIATAPPGGAHKQADAGVDAAKHPITLGTKKVYGARFEGKYTPTARARRSNLTNTR